MKSCTNLRPLSLMETSAYPGMMTWRHLEIRAQDLLRRRERFFPQILGKLGLQITAHSNLKIVNYLDVTLNLSTGKYQPYRNPGNYPLYINAKSNHPPSIIKHLPASISNRISGLSCDSDEFDKASQIYNDVLTTSGYREGLKYVRNDILADRNRRNRPRNII